MQTKLSKQIVYNYIKNFCYDPVYTVTEAIYIYSELSEAPFQFNSSTYYTPDAYVVHDEKLYKVLIPGIGAWSTSSIANSFTNEIYVGEKELADISSGEYNTDRFQYIELEPTDRVKVLEVVDSRTSEVVIAFNNYRSSADYIRSYLSNIGYDIQVEQEGNKFTASWNNHTLDFYSLD